MPDPSPHEPQEKIISRNNLLSLKDRRKWDALLTLVIFFLVLLASVLFNVFTEAEPLIASKDV